jgi:hypothetical protein
VNQRSQRLSQEVKSGEWDQIVAQLSDVTVVCDAWESQGGSRVGHGKGHDLVNVGEGWVFNFQVLVANSVQRVVFNCKAGMGAFDQSVQAEDSVVRLNNNIGVSVVTT